MSNITENIPSTSQSLESRQDVPEQTQQAAPPAATQQSEAALGPQQDAGSQQPSQQVQKKKEPQPYRITHAVEYFSPGCFDRDLADYQAFAKRMTGYDNLDKVQPFYPGLYAVGAISSLGKTTFIHQMADQLAAAGEYVLYFSLEQNKFDLFSESLARGFFRTKEEDTKRNNRPSTYPTPSSIDLRRGDGSNYPSELAAEIDRYVSAVQNHMTIIEGIFSVTVEHIVEFVESIISGGIKPVVIVDYLQIVSPTLMGKRIPDTKTSIDHIVHTLKSLQSKHNLTVIAISSVNRANYSAPIDFESFKESGGIKYTADVVWGLQLSVLDNLAYQREKDTVRKRKMIIDAKLASPRAIDLVCLKNRYGRSSYTVSFDYYASSDIFRPCQTP